MPRRICRKKPLSTLKKVTTYPAPWVKTSLKVEKVEILRVGSGSSSPGSKYLLKFSPSTSRISAIRGVFESSISCERMVVERIIKNMKTGIRMKKKVTIIASQRLLIWGWTNSTMG